jgi:hypothetical protein
VNKKQLKEQLYKMNVPTYGNRIKRNDVERIVAELEVPTEKVTASIIPIDIIHKVAEAIKNALKKGKTEPDLEKLNTFVKSKTSGDLMDLAKSAIDYFKQGKLEWEDGLNLFQNQYQPGGFEIIPWSFLKRQFNYLSPSVEKRLPRAFVQHLSTKASTEVHAELIKVFAGELHKLSEHPKYRKEMQKRERDKKNKEILDTMRKKDSSKTPTPTTPLDEKVIDRFSKEASEIKPISDTNLEELLMNWYSAEDYTAFTLCIDRGLLDYALDYIIGAGGISKDTTDPVELRALARWKKQKNKAEKERKAINKNCEIWVDDTTGEHFYFDTEYLLGQTPFGSMDLDGLDFDSGYDKTGKRYNESIVKKDVG